MSFDNSWDETSPHATDYASTLAAVMRQLKLDIRERIGLEHDMTASDGTLHHAFPIVPTANLPADAAVGTLAYDNTANQLKMCSAVGPVVWSIVGSPIASGTVWPFYQNSAPTGWTVSSVSSNYMMVLAATGGSQVSGVNPVALTGSAVSGGSHTHTYGPNTGTTGAPSTNLQFSQVFVGGAVSTAIHTHTWSITGVTDVGGAHTHTLTMNAPAYATFILCSKN